MSYCGVVLAFEGCGPSGLTTPCATLPLANKPLIYYSLLSLQRANIHDILVVVDDRNVSEVRHAVQDCANINVHINYIGLSCPKDGMPTAHAIKAIQNHIKTSNIVVVECSWVSDMSLNYLLDRHETSFATITCLMSDSCISSTPPGPKVFNKKDYPISAMDNSSGQLLFVGERKEYGETIPIDAQINKKFGCVSLSCKQRTLGVYIMRRGVIELINEVKGLRSIREDVIPYILELQMANDTHGYPKLFLASLEREDCMNLALRMSCSDRAHELIHCTNPVSVHVLQLQPKIHGATVVSHCNLIGPYFETNKVIVKHLQSFEIVGKVMGSDSLIGDESSIGEKTQIKRSVIGKRCNIGANCKIVNSLLMDDVIVEEGCTIASSVVCNRVIIGVGSEIKDCSVGSAHNISASSELNKLQLDVPQFPSFQVLQPHKHSIMRLIIETLPMFMLLLILFCIGYVLLHFWITAICVLVYNTR